MCAQRRFISGLVKLLDLYDLNGEQGGGVELPDYLIIGDDDTYININHIAEMYIHQPKKQIQTETATSEIIIPPPDHPFMFAGCRVRSPAHQITNTFPFGGYGTFLSRGSLSRILQPLHCNDDTGDEFEVGICNKMLRKLDFTYPLSATVGEEKYFERGNSIHRIFDKYIHNITTFCLHSDWFMGYIANFLNVSQQVRVEHDSWQWQGANDTENCLHAVLGDSELYRTPGGQCANGQSPEQK
eukprot:5733424-Ditylum_brightwellii.AAC.1